MEERICWKRRFSFRRL